MKYDFDIYESFHEMTSTNNRYYFVNILCKLYFVPIVEHENAQTITWKYHVVRIKTWLYKNYFFKVFFSL